MPFLQAVLLQELASLLPGAEWKPKCFLEKNKKIDGPCQTFKKLIQQQVEWTQRMECKNEFFIYSLERELF